MKKEQYQLLCTYLKGRYFISTMYRESSAAVEAKWYFETIAWKWDPKSKTIGSIVEMDDSGINEDMAIGNHTLIVLKLNNLITEEDASLTN